MASQKQKIANISNKLYEKLFYGKPYQGGEGLQFHTTPNHLKHITNSLAKKILESSADKKHNILTDIGQVYSSNGLSKLQIWFALLKKYKFRYKLTQDEQWISPENIARKIPDYNSGNIPEQQRRQILKNFRYKLVEFKPHIAVMPTKSLPHNVPFDGSKMGYISWDTMMPDALVSRNPPTSPITLPGNTGRPLTSPITTQQQQQQKFTSIGFKTQGEDKETQFNMDLGGGRKSKRQRKSKRRRKTKGRRKSKRKSSFSKTKKRRK